MGMGGLRLAMVLLVLAGAGCGTSERNIYGGAFGQGVVGNETYVTVSNVWNEMDALPLAQKHCEGYGRTARFNHMERARAIFDCLPR
jgi:hypothetical protein